MLLKDLKCGIYFGMVPPSEIIDFFGQTEAYTDGLFYLVFRKPTSLYALELFNVFAGVAYDAQKQRFHRERVAFERHAERQCGGLYPLWEFEDSLNKQAGAPPLAYLEIIEEAFSKQLHALLTTLNDVTRAPGNPQNLQRLAAHFCTVDGAPAAPSAYAALVKALRFALDEAGMPQPPAQPAAPQAAQPATRARGNRLAAPVAPLPPQAADLKRLVKERRDHWAPDGQRLGGFAQVAPVPMPALSVDDDKARKLLRGWRLGVDQTDDDAGSPYAQHLVQTAKKHESILTKKKEKVTDKLIGEAKGERAHLAGQTYVYGSVYGFRSDTRPPCDLKALGGFQPNALRSDRQDEIWKETGLVMKETKARHDMLDNWSHQANWGSNVSGYVSVAYSMPPALNFYTLQTSAIVHPPPTPPTIIPINNRQEGYIYVVRAMHGVDVEKSFTVGRYRECEISVAGGIGWPDIVGWRKVRWRDVNGRGELVWSGPLHLRTDTDRLPNVKRDAIARIMSYEAQVIWERGKAG